MIPFRFFRPNILSWRYKLICTQRDRIRGDISSSTLDSPGCKTHSWPPAPIAGPWGDTVSESSHTCFDNRDIDSLRFSFKKVTISISISIIVKSLLVLLYRLSPQWARSPCNEQGLSCHREKASCLCKILVHCCGTFRFIICISVSITQSLYHKYSTWQKTVFTHSAITQPKLNWFGWFVTAAVRSLFNKGDSRSRRGRGGRVVESDRQTVRTEGAAKRKRVLSCPLSVRITRPPAERTFCTLYASQLTNSSLSSLWIYSIVTGLPTHSVGGPDQ